MNYNLNIIIKLLIKSFIRLKQLLSKQRLNQIKERTLFNKYSDSINSKANIKIKTNQEHKYKN